MKIKDRHYMKDLMGLILIFAAILIFLSLVSYDPNDLSFNAYPANNPVQNKAGFIGALAAFGLLFTFGFSAYIVPIIIVVFSYYFFKNITYKKMAVKFLIPPARGATDNRAADGQDNSQTHGRVPCLNARQIALLHASCKRARARHDRPCHCLC